MMASDVLVAKARKTAMKTNQASGSVERLIVMTWSVVRFSIRKNDSFQWLVTALLIF
jgi:hypothetical protein